MAGTDSTPVFVKDGQYVSYTTDNAVTIGNVVKVTSATNCDVAGANTAVLGVAVGGDRFSRTQTNNVIAAGSKVTVCTRGIVRVYTGTSNIAVGSLVEAGAAGIVELLGTAGTANSVEDAIGMALDANSSAATTIRIALLRF